MCGAAPLWGVPASAAGPAPEGPAMDATAPTPTPATHVYLLLDRSGSMEAIRTDVVGGVNAFLAGQRRAGADALVTLVQFDTVDAHEVVADAAPITSVADLTTATFVPRGGTPLLDATGDVVHRAEQRVALRARHGLPAEQVLVATVTDGQENSSQRYTRAAVNELVTARTAEGWRFAYLSADSSAYADARALGYDTGSISRYAPSPEGSAAAFASLDRAVGAKRVAVAAAAPLPVDFFEGVKEAEA